MVVGQTGLGKSTLINTLFASHLIDSKGRVDAVEQPRSTTEIHPVSHREWCRGVAKKLRRRRSLKRGEQLNALSSIRLPVTTPVIVENGVKLRLNIVDSPGYGDQINNENW